MEKKISYDSIQKENKKNVRYLVHTILMTLVAPLLASLIIPSWSFVMPMYLGSTMVLLFLDWYLTNYAFKFMSETLEIYLVTAIMSIVSLVIGTLFSAQSFTISFYILLIVIGFWIADDPKKVSLFLTVLVAVFGLCVICFKKTDIAYYLVNCAGVYFLAILISFRVNKIRLEKEERIEKLEWLSTHDQLTELPNRNLFYEKMREKYNGMVTVAMIDIDHFKMMNDSHGHLAGDYALKGISKILASFEKEGLFICRFGGEEFALVTENDKLEEIGEKLVSSIRELKIDFPEMASGYVTISVGLTRGLLMGAHDSDVLLARADEALYDAKTTTRDTYVIK